MAKRKPALRSEIEAILTLNLMLYTAPKEDWTRLNMAITEMLQRPPWRAESFRASFDEWLHLKHALLLDGEGRAMARHKWVHQHGGGYCKQCPCEYRDWTGDRGGRNVDYYPHGVGHGSADPGRVPPCHGAPESKKEER